MGAGGNFIKCRFCGWKTAKYRGKSGPAQAFARLAAHLEDEHESEHTDIFLASQKLKERNDHYEYSMQNEA